MRHSLLAATLVAFLAWSAPAALAQGPKIAVVDVEYVVLKSKKGQSAKNKLKKTFDKKQKELDERQEVLLKLKGQLENPSEMETPERRKKTLMEYQQGLLKLQEDFVKNQQELAQKEMELMKPILKDLEGVMTKLAEDGGYDLIMNRSQQGVIFAKPAYDVTEKVLEALDKK